MPNEFVYEPPVELLRYAQELGEDSIRAHQSFKTTVFVGDKVVFKLAELGKPKTSIAKESHVLKLLRNGLDDHWRSLVPQVIGTREIDGVGLVQAQTRLKGQRPRKSTGDLLKSLGRFLFALHDIGSWSHLDEFEGNEPQSFAGYLVAASQKFLTRLRDKVGEEDWELLQSTAIHLETAAKSLKNEPRHVLVHKDLYLDNLLVNEVHELTGVLDWGAAQTAPKEWEFAILRQRMPEDWREIREAYGRVLDPHLLDLCGLVQSLRFWKSFPGQADFVAQQRDYIREILEHE